jgi:hypothetical protein
MLGIELPNYFFPLEMSVRLSKDERAALIAEFEQGKPLSNSNYYCVRDKNNKVMIRKVKAPKPERTISQIELDKIKKSMSKLEQLLVAQEQSNVPQPAPEDSNKQQKETKAKAL